MADRRLQRSLLALSCGHAFAGVLATGSHPQAAAIGLAGAAMLVGLAVWQPQPLRVRRKPDADPIRIATLRGPRRG